METKVHTLILLALAATCPPPFSAQGAGEPRPGFQKRWFFSLAAGFHKWAPFSGVFGKKKSRIPRPREGGHPPVFHLQAVRRVVGCVGTVIFPTPPELSSIW
jgi:hypothetical protein